MSELYSYTINFTSADKNIDARQMLSKPATLTMGAGNLLSLTERKVVHGVVTRFERTGGSADEAQYCIVLEPFLALLGNQFRTHRFFVNKSVPEVVAEVLTEHGLKGWEFEFTLKPTIQSVSRLTSIRKTTSPSLNACWRRWGFFTSSPCSLIPRPKWCTLRTSRAPGRLVKNSH